MVIRAMVKGNLLVAAVQPLSVVSSFGSWEFTRRHCGVWSSPL
jgi:hypothetical protein